jgi:hypothetical protein
MDNSRKAVHLVDPSARRSWNIEHERFLQIGTDSMIPRYTCHKPFMIMFHDKCEWQKGFKPDIKRSWSGTWMDPRPVRRHWCQDV